MEKKTTNNKYFILSVVFAIIQAINLYLILFDKQSTNLLSLAFIILSASFGIVFSLDKKHYIFLIIAFIFTVIADYFLVIRFQETGDIFDQSAGVTTFIVTQTFYFLFLLFSCDNRKVKIANILTRIVLSIIVLIVAIIVLKEKLNYLVVVSLIYFSFLIINVIFAFIQHKKTGLIFAIGLVFFMLCDILIGLSVVFNAIFEVSTESFIYKLVFHPFNFAWLFYGISQTLIPLSIALNKNIKLN